MRRRDRLVPLSRVLAPSTICSCTPVGVRSAFLLATSDDGRIAAGVHHYPGLLPDHANYCFREPAFTGSADVATRGADLWTGKDAVKLSHEHPSTITMESGEE